MTLALGDRLGPYEIVAPLGAGGMGEVYRARDAKLAREVAVKVLADRFARDAAAVARFEREARAVAALSHPIILAIHDFGREGETVYAVTELLEGETLRSRLGGAPLSVRRAIDLAVPIARGLAAAHEKGIVHRDLKPENIFLTVDGRLKILDFGLAKLLPADPGGADTAAPTIEAATEPGVVLGTLGYMAPEQVRGKPADHRTDIFAFGAILYEMLSGRRAFRGETAADTMSAILKEDPPERSETNRSVPPALERLVRRCLEKSPPQRFQSASDLAYELESMTAASSASVAARPGPFRDAARRVAAPALALAALAAGLAAGHWLWKPRAAAVPSFVRVTFRRGNIGIARFAPDGETVVYGASWEGAPVALFSTRIGNPESTPLGYAKANLAALSSTGELALSLRDQALSGTQGVGTLARAPLGGGEPRPMLEFVDAADWAPDGKDLAIVRQLGGRSRLEYPVGNVLVSSVHLDSPRFSPRGNRIAFVEQEPRGTTIGFTDRKGAVTRLPGEWQGVSSVAWDPSGDAIWFAASGVHGDSTVYRTDLRGRAAAVFSIPDGAIVHDVAKDGRVLLERYHPRRGIIARPPGATVERDLTWFDLSDLVDMSADGSTVLFTERAAAGGRAGSFFLRKTDGSPAVKLGDGMAFELSPDGQWVLARLEGSPGLALVPTGAGTPIPLPRGEIEKIGAGAFFPDGKRLLVVGAPAANSPRWYVQEIPGGTPRVFNAQGFGTSGKPISPDGRVAVAFRDWQEDLYLLPFDGGPARPIPGTKQLDPVEWTPDGRSIYAFESGSIPARIVKIDVSTGARTPFENLFPASIPTVISIRNPLLTPDGRGYAFGYSSASSSDLYVVDLRE
ncbi:MAG TPA: protein kinase [Thermoanaerobaculia bacterium]|nr:protein kinase [Thermoanaerobaculia bacterium]